MNYWRWLFTGKTSSSDKPQLDNADDKSPRKQCVPGFYNYCDLWFIIHLVVAFILSEISTIPLDKAAETILLPLAGILIGIVSSWSGNAQHLLSSNEIQKLARFHPSGIEEYVFTYQSAILIVLITMSLWGIAGIGTFDYKWPTLKNEVYYYMIKVLLFFFSSLTIRECWSIVLGSHLMLLSKIKICEKNSNPGK